MPQATEKKSQEAVINTQFYITGLDCADCADKLEKGLSRLPGIEAVKVNFGNSSMVVTHQAPVEEIASWVEKMGYSAEPSPDRRGLKPISFWRSNPYVWPTVISLTMLLLGLASGRLGALPLLSHSLLLIGVFLGGLLPAKNGLAMLVNARQVDMNVLMVIAVGGALVIGQFEEAATVVFLFSLGNALQGYTLDRTRNSIQALMELAPNQALVRRGDLEIVLPVEQIRVGDTVVVRPGERIPMDGRVLAGLSSVNQAPITGESIPVDKQPGDEVYAGTINEQGSLEVQVTRLAENNTIARIIELVEEAQGQKAPSQQLVDRFARYYTPMVIGLAALVAIIPPLALGQPFQKWFYEAMAMLLVACPCALVISTPVAIVSAIGNAAKNGVLIKGGFYLEELGRLRAVAFDKTGTLTLGRPRVTDLIPLEDSSEEELLSLAAAIECRSEHPLARAIVDWAQEKNLDIPPVNDFEAFFGRGARGDIGNTSYYVGNSRLFQEKNLLQPAVVEQLNRLQKKGKTVVLLGNDNGVLGILALADALRSNSRQAVESLKQVGIRKVIMLTGDNPATAQAVTCQAGVDEYIADLLPSDKVESIQQLQVQYGKVAMVGDGVNDAPAMATATVGIAMGVAGSDTALETADIALMADDLTRLPYVVKLGRRTLTTIKQNIALALFIKLAILLLVIPGWLTLWLAVIGDMGSSLLVILNGMRLLRARPQG